MSRIPVTGTLGKFTWRMLAMVLGGQAIVIGLGALVARGTAIASGDDNAETLLWGGVALAVLALIAAGLMRGPLGLPLGWLVQLLTWASAVVVPAMIGVGLVFTGLWVYMLVKGQETDALVAARERDAESAR
ncbi:DUF4233 domain-containing protein [Knoellia subterranea]|uniref:DUF4233 domain-containing protein n=1 Tax=Knoellia subterranea KCTC 19937 TaxID=1385521 RepID=A0A0A0JTZ6_9MICO|nr:DUF4233 domain-containing protein [Knoellia subterranea]KGN39146.1 hypothetical protein N803_01150 [Knoellia subterranea KCTC 19937]